MKTYTRRLNIKENCRSSAVSLYTFIHIGETVVMKRSRDMKAVWVYSIGSKTIAYKNMC